MPVIYYSCRLPPVAGGELVNLQHVASLGRLGWRAVALLDGSSPPIGPAKPLPLPTVSWNESLVFNSDDVLVLPEVCLERTWRDLARIPCRKVVHNQNPYYSFNGFHDIAALDDYGFSGAICCSGFTRSALQRWGSRLDWQVVRPHVLEMFFREGSESGVARKLQIAYMPRKRPTEAGLLRHIFQARYPEWRHIPWVEINGMSRKMVAKILGESEVFLSLSHFEGLGLPPLEAMAAGSLVCGYTGGGGAEYATPENGVWADEGDIEKCVESLAELLARDAPARQRLREAGLATASMFSLERFENELDLAWQAILGGDSVRYRLDAVEATG